MKPHVALLGLAALLPVSAYATQPTKPVVAPVWVDIHEPVPGKQDPRLRTFAYNPGIPVRITSTGLTPVRLVFAPGETKIAFAGPLVSKEPDKAKHWFAVNYANTAILQPLHGDIPISFLFIQTTTEDGLNPRNYTVELHTRDGDVASLDDPLNYVQVTFTYARDPAEVATERQQQRAAAAQSAISTRITQARYDVPRNWHYNMRGAGCSALAPTGRNWISDDSHQVTMLFPGHMQVPVVNTTDDAGEPKLITPTPISTRAGTLYVLPAVYQNFELRRGLLVCELAPDPAYYDPTGTVTGDGSGTISPDVILRARH